MQSQGFLCVSDPFRSVLATVGAIPAAVAHGLECNSLVKSHGPSRMLLH